MSKMGTVREALASKRFDGPRISTRTCSLVRPLSDRPESRVLKNSMVAL